MSRGSELLKEQALQDLAAHGDTTARWALFTGRFRRAANRAAVSVSVAATSAQVGLANRAQEAGASPESLTSQTQQLQLNPQPLRILLQ